ncbi:hypothetical protein K438DRAFT_1987531 [Mycena galopus ATCC 62051]|nr:hypothetical protein K438DRAFT_1987531 [Mycena galopus ATCC 62051]
MHAMSTLLKIFTLVGVLAAVARAEDTYELTPEEQASIQCAADGASTEPSASPKTMFYNVGTKECKCDLKAPATGDWIKCPMASVNPEDGFAMCRKDTGCSVQCFQNAILENGQCVPYPIAESPDFDTSTDKECKKVNTVIGAFPSKPCMCFTPEWIKQSGGQVCKEGIPENAFATCLRSSLEVGDSHCDFQCKPGFKKSADGKSCESGDNKPKIEEPSTSPGGGETEPALELAAACVSPFGVSYSSASAPCGCVPNLKYAKKRQPDAVVCLPPAKNGKVGCRNKAPGSKCSVACDDGYKPSEDEANCVIKREDVTMSEMECSAEAGQVGYLTADPVLGCVCKTEITENFCGFPAGDDEDAEQMCSDTTDSSGKREVKCNVKCSEGFVATDKNTCEKVEMEGETVTYAGTANPRDDSSEACTEKVWALPGKGGCKCAAEKPEGAEECEGVSSKEYAICGYEKGSGDPAYCATECVKGAFKKPPTNTCK